MKQKILNINHYFFFFETECWIQRLSDKIYYTGFKAQANKTTADGNTEKVMKIPFIINPEKLIILK
jgi:hypothetical protein